LQFPAVLFGPVIEHLTSPDAFITESPEDVYNRNATANYPWILTQVADEGHIVSLCNYIILILPLQHFCWSMIYIVLIKVLTDSSADNSNTWSVGSNELETPFTNPVRPQR